MSKTNSSSTPKGKKTGAASKASPAKQPSLAKKVSAVKPKPAAASKTSGAKASVPTAKSPVVKASAPVKRAVKSTANPPATLVAEIDVGFGNQLFIRGGGGGLSWDKGILMTCVGDSRWEWSGKVPAPVACKVILNDTIWSEGEDITLAPGETKVVRPTF